MECKLSFLNRNVHNTFFLAHECSRVTVWIVSAVPPAAGQPTEMQGGGVCVEHEVVT